MAVIGDASIAMARPSPITANLGTTLCNGLDPVIDGACAKRASPCFAAVGRPSGPRICSLSSSSTASSLFTGPKWAGRLAASRFRCSRPTRPAPAFHLSAPPARCRSCRLARVPALPECRRNTVRRRPDQSGNGGSLRRGLACVNTAKGHTAPAVMGDVQSAFGEGTVALAQLVESGQLNPLSTDMLNGTGPVPAPYIRTGGKVKV